MQREVMFGKLRAAVFHLLVTLAMAALCAFLVFIVWFPAPFYQMLGGTKLFLLVTVSDLILGPLITLVIYTPTKAKSVLLRDYAVVVLIQLAALTYGLHTVAQSRPVFIVFSVDGFDVVTAADLKDEDLRLAKQSQWQHRSWTGPQFVWAPMPTDPKERTDLTFNALNGKDIQFQPKYYRSFSEGQYVIVERSKPISDLVTKHPEYTDEIRKAIATTQQPENALVWSPIRGFESIWTVMLDKETAMPKAWIDLDPY